MKLRVKFTKHGAVRYIGHLDTQRYFQRVNRRAGLSVVYSEGFSPHQRMSFAMPLSVGYESDAEYFDVEVREAVSSGEIMNALNAEQAEGIRVIDCVKLPDGAENAMASVRAADYMVRFRDGYEPPFDIRSAVESLRSSEYFIVRKENKKAKKRGKKISHESYSTQTMKGDAGAHDGSEQDGLYRETDIRGLIHDIYFDEEKNAVFMKVSAGSKDNVKPELILSSLYRNAGHELLPYALLVTRCELYTCNKDGRLIPLSGVGERF